ncbi:hypothetical protein ACWIVY_08790 [Ursidibacter sp. B-7004-1]
MIFQKKIIIGSIMSFIATAVGIVAVFFPDLLNLQKEKMKKLDIFISSLDDSKKLEKFLYDNSGKIVELKVAYCLENADDSPALVKVDQRSNRFVLDNYYVDAGGGKVRPNVVVMPDNSGRAHSYSWSLGLVDYPKPEYAEKCKINGPIYRGELLSGIFIVELESFNPYQYLISLQPLSKNDLKLRDY